MTVPEIASTADCLRTVAEILERGEHAFSFMASAMGMPVPDLLQVRQEYVLVLAAWLDIHPDIDEQMRTALESVDTAR